MKGCAFMTQRNKRIISFIITLSCVTMLSSSPIKVYAATTTSVNNLRNEISDIQKKKDALDGQLSELSSEKSKLLKNKSILEQQTQLNEEELEKKEQLIDSLSVSIAEKSAELSTAKEEESVQYENFKERVRVMYEHGSVSYVEALLESQSFSDMLSRLEIISQIIKYDNNIMAKLAETRKQINDAKESLEQSKSEQEQLKNSLEKTKAELADRISQCDALTEQIASDEETVKAIYAEMESEEEKLQAELKKQIAELAKKDSYVGGTMMWPLPGYTYITSPFGMRLHPTLKVYKLHSGVDISAPKGVKILAANDGTVIISQYNKAWGNYVVINHGGGIATLYAHMTKASVSKGDTIQKGQVIGTVGSTGYSTGNHLHFEIQRDGKSEDPFAKEFSK